MTDILDKAILIGLGLEKRVKDALNKLASEGKEAKTGEGGELPPKQELENKLVDEGVKAVRELVATVKAGKEKVDKEMGEADRRVGKEITKRLMAEGYSGFVFLLFSFSL